MLRTSDPRKHNPKKFCYIVKTMFNQHNDWFNMEVISCSCITEKHTTTLGGFGYILEVPKENILAMYNRDVMSGRKKLKDMPAKIKKCKEKNYKTLDDLMKNAIPRKHNEVIVKLDDNVKRLCMFFKKPKRGNSGFIDRMKQPEDIIIEVKDIRELLPIWR